MEYTLVIYTNNYYNIIIIIYVTVPATTSHVLTKTEMYKIRATLKNCDRACENQPCSRVKFPNFFNFVY